MVRPPWLPNSRIPRDRDEKETGLNTLANRSRGGATLRNQSAAGRRRTRHRSHSMRSANNDDGVDVMKVIECGLRTPGHVHHLLVVSTVSVIFGLFYFVFIWYLLLYYLCILFECDRPPSLIGCDVVLLILMNPCTSHACFRSTRICWNSGFVALRCVFRKSGIFGPLSRTYTARAYARIRTQCKCCFREMIPRTRKRTTRVAFWDPPSGSKNALFYFNVVRHKCFFCRRRLHSSRCISGSHLYFQFMVSHTVHGGFSFICNFKPSFPRMYISISR